MATKTLGTYGESVDLFKLQFQYGQVSQMNVAQEQSQSQSQYETAAAQIPMIESQIAQNQNALLVLIGRNPGPIARGKPIEDLALPKVPAGVPSQLLERRPDLLQSEQQLIAANAQIGAGAADAATPELTPSARAGERLPRAAQLQRTHTSVLETSPAFTFSCSRPSGNSFSSAG